MTLELVNESDVRKAGDKEKKPELKPGLRLVDESDIKKVGSEKKSWLDIVNESDTRKVGEKVKKPGLEFVVRERIIYCERQRDSMTNNCALCKELSKERFDRCPNKYGGF